MGKRGNGEGSKPRKRPDGRWEARYTIQTPAGPKRKTLYGKTRSEVAAKLTKAMADRDGGLVFDDKKMTVGEFLDKWLSDCVRDSVRESTFDRDGYLVRVHIKPALGRIKLSKLSPVHVQGFYRDRLDAGLSASTVNKIHTVLHKALSQAVKWSLNRVTRCGQTSVLQIMTGALVLQVRAHPEIATMDSMAACP